MVGFVGFPAPWVHALVLVRLGVWEELKHGNLLSTRQEQIPAPQEKNMGEYFKGDPPAEAQQSDGFSFGSSPEWVGLAWGTGRLGRSRFNSEQLISRVTASCSIFCQKFPIRRRGWGGQKAHNFTSGQEEVKPLNYWKAHSQGLLGPCLQTNKVYLNLTFSVKSGAGRESTPTKTALVLAWPL